MLYSFLLLIALYGILQIVAKIIAQRKCLSAYELKGIAYNQLKGAEKRRVTSHLGICSSCRVKLENYDYDQRIEDHLIERDKP